MPRNFVVYGLFRFFDRIWKLKIRRRAMSFCRFYIKYFFCIFHYAFSADIKIRFRFSQIWPGPNHNVICRVKNWRRNIGKFWQGLFARVCEVELSRGILKIGRASFKFICKFKQLPFVLDIELRWKIKPFWVSLTRSLSEWRLGSKTFRSVFLNFLNTPIYWIQNTYTR